MSPASSTNRAYKATSRYQGGKNEDEHPKKEDTCLVRVLASYTLFDRVLRQLLVRSRDLASQLQGYQLGQCAGHKYKLWETNHTIRK